MLSVIVLIRDCRNVPEEGEPIKESVISVGKISSAMTEENASLDKEIDKHHLLHVI
jgi:hypothetical protein